MTKELEQKPKTRQIRVKLHSIILVESTKVRDQKDFAKHYLVPGIENNSLNRQLTPVILGLKSEPKEQIVQQAYEHMNYDVNTEFIIVVRPEKDRGELVRELAEAAKIKNYNMDSTILRGDASAFDISVTGMGLYDSMWLPEHNNYVILKDFKSIAADFIEEVTSHGFHYDSDQQRFVPSNEQANKTVFIIVKGLFKDELYNDTIGTIIFNSLKYFLIVKDPSFDNKLFQNPNSIPGALADGAREFFRNDGIIVSYGPCRLKFLGKADKESLRMQQGFDPHFDDEADNWPVHFCGSLDESIIHNPRHDD